ncbi:MAG: PIN domain-containing protein [Lachnospiraceae bacterium]|nr:PIN domain-containing protein [Lachnospiraceae bacterium]
MKKYYAVIDTNVLVSAALRMESVPGSIIELVFTGVVIPLINESIVTEYREVLSRDKFRFPTDVVDDLVSGICRNAISVNEKTLEVELPDPKYRVFYEVTMEGRKTDDTYLVTGNLKHFPVEPFIVSPREMLDIIVEGIDSEC